MESQKQLRMCQEDCRLTRLANTSLQRDAEAVKAQFQNFRETTSAELESKHELQLQVHLSFFSAMWWCLTLMCT
jgi:hypothetical protein